MTSDSENMEAASKIMQAFQNQTNMLQGGNPAAAPTVQPGTNEFDNQGGEFATPGDGNTIGTGFDNQGDPGQTSLMQPGTPNPQQPVAQPQMQPVTQPVAQPQMQPVAQPPSNPMASPMPSQRADVCPECNSMHPPLRPGEQCPNAGISQDISVNAGITDDVVNKHLVDMRNIIIANMTSKGIKNGKKFFQYAVVELAKALEVYHE